MFAAPFLLSRGLPEFEEHSQEWLRHRSKKNRTLEKRGCGLELELDRKF
jgi:hypothetical protein